MEFLVELILEILFEVPLDAAMESRRLKTGIKTAIFSTLGGGVVALFAYIAVDTWINGDETSAFFISLITIVLLFLVLFGAIKGHRSKWKSKHQSFD